MRESSTKAQLSGRREGCEHFKGRGLHWNAQRDREQGRAGMGVGACRGEDVTFDLILSQWSFLERNAGEREFGGRLRDPTSTSPVMFPHSPNLLLTLSLHHLTPLDPSHLRPPIPPPAPWLFASCLLPHPLLIISSLPSLNLDLPPSAFPI